MMLTDRVKCAKCLWACWDAGEIADAPSEPNPCHIWTDAETGETVADLARQIRLARARRERCAGCAMWDAEDGYCHRQPQNEAYLDASSPSKDWCGEWQPSDPSDPLGARQRYAEILASPDPAAAMAEALK